MQTSPDDDEAQLGDQSHLGDTSEPQQARRRHDKELIDEQERVTPGDEEDGSGPRP